MPIYKMSGIKDNKQRYRVRINYIDIEGKNKQIDRVAYGFQEAKELEKRLMDEVKLPRADSRKTIQHLYDEYISVKKHEVRETSLSKTESIMCNYVLPELSGLKLDRLTLPVLQKWKSSINERRIIQEGCEPKPLGITTRKNIFGEFRAMLNYGVKMSYIAVNPLPLIGNFKDAYATKSSIGYYTAQEFNLFIAAAKKEAEAKAPAIEGWHYYIFFMIAFYTGMRKGEINALKWSDIEGDIIHVRRSIAQKLKGGDRETPPKNKSSYRSLQMPKVLKNALDSHKALCYAEDLFSDDWRICGGEVCLRDTSISNRNIAYAAAAGIKSIRIHDYRHSHASLLANAGINIQEIARRLGHSKIEITWNTYSHLYPKEEERAIAVLDSSAEGQIV